MTYKCNVCLDTGEVGQLGSLDCVHCDAAETRATLNAAIAALPPMTKEDLAWYIFQAGRKAEAAKQDEKIALLRASLRAMWGYAIELDHLSYFEDDLSADRAEKEHTTQAQLKDEWNRDINKAAALLRDKKF